MIKRALRALFGYLGALATTEDNEQRQPLKFLLALKIRPDARILEVGCGYGRIMRALKKGGYDPIGVEINTTITTKIRDEGLHCIAPEDLDKDMAPYDAVVMFHVIEHFEPRSLRDFIDSYVDRIAAGGYLIIATPLLSNTFYDDFDHIKPYQPTGLLMVFAGDDGQVQFYGRNKIKLVDLWFRREPFCIRYLRSVHIYSRGTRLVALVNFLSALAFKCSGGLIGKTNGWMGVYQKV